ncbi:MFS transporter [Alteribacter aurantiacus]|uniref:MFS transporter n=1 Tax=Alteribacter aurantiacus TaxID=254410 RepID=UPI00041650B6|nr:MFS transporter [Alteribacter aurantiacus]
MSEKLQIFMEYKVKEDMVTEYEQVMKDILPALSEYGAEEVDWYEAADQKHLYVEMFTLPTMSHYHAMKKRRCTNEHPLFSKLDSLVEGGVKKVHCWAFVQKKQD